MRIFDHIQTLLGPNLFGIFPFYFEFHKTIYFKDKIKILAFFQFDENKAWLNLAYPSEVGGSIGVRSFLDQLINTLEMVSHSRTILSFHFDSMQVYYNWN